jgi:hypothetical protein
MMNFEYDASQDVLSGERLTTAYRINQPPKLSDKMNGFSVNRQSKPKQIQSKWRTHDDMGRMHGIILQKI